MLDRQDSFPARRMLLLLFFELMYASFSLRIVHSVTLHKISEKYCGA